MTRREEILDQLEKLPALSAAAEQIVRQLSDPDVDLGQAVLAIESSPELTGNLLRVANSAQFAGARTIGSVREALVRLGTRQVTELVLTSSVAPLAKNAVCGYDLPHGKLLEHSLAVAATADTMVRHLGRKSLVDAFTLGLLHDLGKIALSSHLEIDAEPILELAFDQHVSFETAEARVLGIDHAEAGAFLLERWGLPEALVTAVRYHHKPDTFEGDPQMQFCVDVVHVSDILVMETGVGAGIDGLNYQVSAQAAARLGVQNPVAEHVVNTMLTRMEEMREVLEIAGGREGSCR